MLHEYKEKFKEIFGGFREVEFNGSKLYMTGDKVIFCYYPVALGIIKSFGIRSEIVLLDNLWRVKNNGKWYKICEYFGFLSEELLNNAKKILHPANKLHIRWPIERSSDYIVVTNGKFAVMLPPSNIAITKVSDL